jgi:hypothetical protein
MNIKVGDTLVSEIEKCTAIVTSIEEDPEDLGTKYYVDLSDGHKGLITTLDWDEEGKQIPGNIISWTKLEK